MAEQLIIFRSSINEQIIKQKYNINMAMAKPKFRRQLNIAIVRIRIKSIKKSKITEHTMPDELTVTSPKIIAYINQGNGNLD